MLVMVKEKFRWHIRKSRKFSFEISVSNLSSTMISQDIALWVIISTQSKGGFSHRKKGRYYKLVIITFDSIGIFG